MTRSKTGRQDPEKEQEDPPTTPPSGMGRLNDEVLPSSENDDPATTTSPISRLTSDIIPDRSVSEASDVTTRAMSSDIPALSDQESKMASEWMEDVYDVLQEEQYYLETEGEINPSVMKTLHQDLEQLCLDFRALPRTVRKSKEVRELSSTIGRKFHHYSEGLRRGTMRQENVRHEIDTRQNQQTNSTGREAAHFDFLREKDLVDRLPKFESGVLDYAAWRHRFIKALADFKINNPILIKSWMQHEILPRLEREVRDLIDREDDYENWIKILDQKFHSIE